MKTPDIHSADTKAETSADASSTLIIRPVQIGRVNWIGLYTLYTREVHRFMKVATQTLAAPVITSWPRDDDSVAKRLRQYLIITCCLKGAGEHR